MEEGIRFNIAHILKKGQSLNHLLFTVGKQRGFLCPHDQNDVYLVFTEVKSNLIVYHEKFN